LIAGLFSFLLTLIRELIKDLEDIEGDAAFGCRTLPIVAGTRVSKLVIIAITLITMGILGYIMSFQFASDKVSFSYFLVALFLPLGLLAYLVWKADTKKMYSTLSRLSKVIMLAGIFYALIYNYLLKHS